ncbi:acetylornithine deacetylase [Exophiala viscosa]|uniref:acetylornithine deacetylase n=1 Tax=Exophiala viscosa TaxID=2486360 RepID=UPI00219F054A|nr:acetylornithine deacetylase [Exophiala viscosa]
MPAEAPKDVSIEEVVALTQTPVQIDSSNPDFGSTGGPGETAIATYINAWLQHRDIETHWIEQTKGRPSVVGIVRGSGGGKSLMFNGHIDTVTLLGYDGDALGAQIIDGNMYGRGTADMKSGLAAAMLALLHAKTLNLKGDVILAAVADEESESRGTEQLLAAGWRADAAIIAEPTGTDIINTHKGFALFEVDIHGKASHGSRPDLGIDAIAKAGYFLVELDKFAHQLQRRFDKEANPPETGAPSIHCGIIKGREEVASYPAKCTIHIERRNIAGETQEGITTELEVILENPVATVPDFKYELRSTFFRPPYYLPRDHAFIKLVEGHLTTAMGGASITIRAEKYWTDAALLSDVDIPSVILGPRGYGLHSEKEWVEVESLRQLSDAFKSTMEEFCS